MRSLVFAFLLANAAIARADEPPPTPLAPPVEVAELVDPPAAPAPPRTGEAWLLYHRAFTALADHDRALAQRFVARLLRTHAGEPAAIAATPIAEALAVPPTGELGPEPERPSAVRAELGLVQALNGMSLGIEACIAASCRDDSAWFGLALLGGGAGAIVSVYVLDRPSAAERAALDNGALFGFLEGTFAALALDSSKPANPILIGQLGGTLVGSLLTTKHASAGQIALASSGGLWATTIALLSATALTNEWQDTKINTFGLVGLGALNAGVIGGALLARAFPDITRGETLVLDAGGIAGSAGGAAIGILIANDPQAPIVYGLAAGGAALGLVITSLAAHTFDLGRRAERAGIAPQALVLPVEHGRGATVGVGFRF